MTVNDNTIQMTRVRDSAYFYECKFKLSYLYMHPTSQSLSFQCFKW